LAKLEAGAHGNREAADATRPSRQREEESGAPKPSYADETVKVEQAVRISVACRKKPTLCCFDDGFK
jgi:hypothetical protein